MQTLKEFKDEIRNYYRTADHEKGETFKTFFEDMINALDEEGKVIKKGRQIYIAD